MTDFKIGDRVRKTVGFPFVGTIRSDYTTGAGKRRFDVEHDDGWMHVHNPEHLAFDRPEYQYLDLLRECRDKGAYREGRNGGTYGLFGRQIHFDLAQGFPLLTTKKVSFKRVAGELMWFLEGSTNRNRLEEITFGTIGVNKTIWDEWADKNGALGPVYGSQWRDWTALRGCDEVYQIDQIAELIQNLKTDPYSRRHIITAWNPAEIGNMALPPCHCLFQFFVADGKLSCRLDQRSADIFLGVPYNIASYALLTHLVAREVGLEVGEFIHQFGDVHLYANHIEQADEQLSREPRAFPKLKIWSGAGESNLTLPISCFELEGYDPHPPISAPVSV